MTFEMYSKDLGLSKPVEYIHTSQQSVDWFDPLKPYTALEYEWVIKNVDLKGKTVIDAGCHQGNYAVVFAACGARVIAIDAHRENCIAAKLNLDQYGHKHQVHNFAVWNMDGMVNFSGQSNGKVIGSGGVEVACKKLSSFGSAEVVKIDIEGAEFDILPQALFEMKETKTWIIEIHPEHDPTKLIYPFKMAGYDLYIVDRDRMKVTAYYPRVWTTHSTVIAVKR